MIDIQEEKFAQKHKGMKLYTVTRTEVWTTQVYAWSKDHAVTRVDDEQIYANIDGDGCVAKFSMTAQLADGQGIIERVADAFREIK